MHTSVDNPPIKSEPAASPLPSNLLRLLWQRKWLVLLGVAVGLVMGTMVYARAQPTYRSSAQVLVIKKRTDVVPVAAADLTQSYLEDYVSTHIVLLKSPVILDQAVKKGNLKTLRTFEGESNPIYMIAGGLTVARDTSGSSRTIIDLTYQGAYPEETATILNAVIESYTDFLEGVYRTVSKETEGLILKASNVLKKDLEDKEKKYREFREKSPFLVRGKDGINVHQARVFEIEGKKSALLIQKSDLEARLRLIEEAKKDGKVDLALIPFPSEMSTGKDPSMKKDPRSLVEEHLVPLILDERELLQDFGEDHPRVRAVRAKIERARQLLTGTNKFAEEAHQALANSAGNPAEFLARYLRSIRQELAQIEVSLKALTDLAETEVAEAKVSKQYEDIEDGYRAEIGRTQQIYAQTIKRLDEVNLVRDFGGYDARVIAPAGTGARVAAGLFRTMMICVFMGLMAGLGLAYLADATDRSFRTPEEIRRSLGLAILGHIPYQPGSEKTHKGDGQPHGAEEYSSALCVYHQPASLEAEAYRSLRTALYFGTRGEGHRVIQITSPNMGDGKTTLVSNLAIAIAQSGKRVIIVDADLRRPRIHGIFGLASNQTGLTAVLAGEVPLAEAIKPTTVPGLDLLPCGTRPSNPAELLTSGDFDRVLAELRRDYDYILVDTPPLLAVTDPCVVAGRVDGVLLTIRVSKNGRPTAERAKELLSNIGVNVIGVVVNGIGRDQGGYGYGYRYYSYDHYGTEYRSDEGEADKPEEQVVSCAKATGGPSALEKAGFRAGIFGGLAMILIAVGWFVLGLAADMVLIYPPILFVVGLGALIMGIRTGSGAGEK